MHEDRSHLAPADGDSHHRQRADLDKFGDGMERIFGKWKPKGSQGKIRPKDRRVDVTTTTSALRNTVNDDYRKNMDKIFRKDP